MSLGRHANKMNNNIYTGAICQKKKNLTSISFGSNIPDLSLITSSSNKQIMLVFIDDSLYFLRLLKCMESDLIEL